MAPGRTGSAADQACAFIDRVAVLNVKREYRTLPCGEPGKRAIKVEELILEVDRHRQCRLAQFLRPQPSDEPAPPPQAMVHADSGQPGLRMVWIAEARP
jgi:hypothetical protein